MRPEETVLDLHGREYGKRGVLIVSPETRLVLVLARAQITPPVEVQFFRNNFFCGNLVLQKSWNSHQPRLGIAPLARFRGPIARSGANSLPGPLPLGR